MPRNVRRWQLSGGFAGVNNVYEAPEASSTMNPAAGGHVHESNARVAPGAPSSGNLGYGNGVHPGPLASTTNIDVDPEAPSSRH